MYFLLLFHLFSLFHFIFSCVFFSFTASCNIISFLIGRNPQQVFDESLSKVQKKLDDMKKSQAQCEETIRLKDKLMVIISL